LPNKRVMMSLLGLLPPWWAATASAATLVDSGGR
jgi:hypothetical protein